ncbi:MAG: NADP-dependent glyceraldehyde-3-phosphate dehydrogenase [Acidobacteria bacterium]|nr:NADP-dependent glyceraldehyde-3-phosphate dehydrogenase [Acidobacteriota bacterium]
MEGAPVTHSTHLEALFPDQESIPELIRLPGFIKQTEFLADGHLREWDGPFQNVESPLLVRTATGLARTVIGQAPRMTAEASLTVLEAAVRAYGSGRGAWPTMSVSERIGCVGRFAGMMRDRKRDIVRLLVWEIAKTVPDAEKELDRTLQYIDDTIDALKDLDRAGSRFTITDGIIAQIRRAPLGVALCLGPYNYPLNETFTILIPALIMGNTIVCKPAKLGVLLHRPLLEAYRDAFPPGVVNTVYGDGETIIGPLMDSGKIDVLGFIGSTKVADTLKDRHPQPHRLRSILGLGAKNPAILLPDADVELAVRECVQGSLSYNGQRCTGLKILFVHRAVIDQFLSRFATAVEQLRLGMPWEDRVTITPLPVPGKPGYLTELVDDAVRHGARVVNDRGGTSCETMFTPAILSPVTPEMRLYHEEQFGPVVPVVPFDDLRVPIEWVEKSRYGQQVSIFGTDPAHLAELIDPLVNQVCRVNINSQCQRGPDAFPFTGRKDSAEGTLSVSDALRAFSIRTLVATKECDANRSILSAIVRERRSNFLSTDFIF